MTDNNKNHKVNSNPLGKIKSRSGTEWSYPERVTCKRTREDKHI